MHRTVHRIWSQPLCFERSCACNDLQSKEQLLISGRQKAERRCWLQPCGHLATYRWVVERARFE